MKKVILFLLLGILSACAYRSEKIIGYNEEGKTLVEVCDSSVGGETVAYSSKCVIDSRDYGNVKNKKEVVESMSFNKNTAILIAVCVLLLFL